MSWVTKGSPGACGTASPQDTVADSSGLLQLDTLTSRPWGIMESPQTLFFRQERGKGSVVSKPGGAAWPWHSWHSPCTNLLHLPTGAASVGWESQGLGSKLEAGVEGLSWDGTRLALGKALLSLPLSFVYSSLDSMMSENQL